MRCFYCCALHLFFVFTTTADVYSWSKWYKTNKPADGDTKQVLQTVRQIVGTHVCKCGSILVQCRMFGQVTLFNGTQHNTDNFLSIPCKKSGVICLFLDERAGTRCADYEIRYQCGQADVGSSSISSRAEFIALIACLSVILPILGVTAFQFIRARRQVRRQHLISVNSDTTGQPPSYDEICFDEATVIRNTAAIRPETGTPEAGNTSVVSNVSGGGLSPLRLDRRRARNVPGNCELLQTVTEGVDFPRSIETQMVCRIFVVNDSNGQSDTNIVLPVPPPSYDEAVQMIKTQSGVE